MRAAAGVGGVVGGEMRAALPPGGERKRGRERCSTNYQSK
jgi:hypothetical protein